MRSVVLWLLVMFSAIPITSFFQGYLIPTAPRLPLRGFGSTFEVLALVAIILNILRPQQIITLPTTSPTECPSGYSLYSTRCGRFCYRLEKQHCLSFSNARAYCVLDGGDLLNVDPCYYDFFIDLAERNQGGCDDDIWIGASSSTPVVNYVTVRGEAIPQDSVLWGTNEPDAPEDGGCLQMEVDYNYRLDDEDCTVDEAYICQIFI